MKYLETLNVAKDAYLNNRSKSTSNMSKWQGGTKRHSLYKGASLNIGLEYKTRQKNHTKYKNQTKEQNKYTDTQKI